MGWCSGLFSLALLSWLRNSKSSISCLYPIGDFISLIEDNIPNWGYFLLVVYCTLRFHTKLNLLKTELYASWALFVWSLLLPKQDHMSGLYTPSIQVVWMYSMNSSLALDIFSFSMSFSFSLSITAWSSSAIIKGKARQLLTNSANCLDVLRILP